MAASTACSSHACAASRTATLPRYRSRCSVNCSVSRCVNCAALSLAQHHRHSRLQQQRLFGIVFVDLCSVGSRTCMSGVGPVRHWRRARRRWVSTCRAAQPASGPHGSAPAGKCTGLPAASSVRRSTEQTDRQNSPTRAACRDFARTGGRCAQSVCARSHPVQASFQPNCSAWAFDSRLLSSPSHCRRLQPMVPQVRHIHSPCRAEHAAHWLPGVSLCAYLQTACVSAAVAVSASHTGTHFVVALGKAARMEGVVAHQNHRCLAVAEGVQRLEADGARAVCCEHLAGGVVDLQPGPVEQRVVLRVRTCRTDCRRQRSSPNDEYWVRQ